MINLLMCNPPIVLQDIVILRSGCDNELLDYGLYIISVPFTTAPGMHWVRAYQYLDQLIIRNVRDLRAMGLWDHKLFSRHQLIGFTMILS
jgi:hypothetical protein